MLGMSVAALAALGCGGSKDTATTPAKTGGGEDAKAADDGKAADDAAPAADDANAGTAGGSGSGSKSDDGAGSGSGGAGETGGAAAGSGGAGVGDSGGAGGDSGGAGGSGGSSGAAPAADDEGADEGGSGGGAADTDALVKEIKNKRTTDERALEALAEIETAGMKLRDVAKAANARGVALHATPDRAKTFFVWAMEKDDKYPDPAFNLAKQAANLGEVAETVQYLTEVKKRGGKKLLQQVDFDPMWEIVKDDPDVRALLR